MKSIPTSRSSPADTLATIGPIARSSVVDAVADRLRGEILAERIPAGTRLPSERELSLALGVNRLTLRAALSRLEALGLISTRHGAGTLVASWRERAGLDALAALIGSLSPWEPAWRELVTAMLELRRGLVAEAVALAAARHTPGDLEAMSALAAEQEGRVHDAIAFARGDLAFLRSVVRAAKNVGLELVLNTFARFPDEQPGLIAALYDRRDESIAYYGAVIDFVRAGKPDAAREAIRAAFVAMDEEWNARNAPRGTAPHAERETSALLEVGERGARGPKKKKKKRKKP
jgi:GntR family transcriptional repressor for pyruvate dehydrogenase complex